MFEVATGVLGNADGSAQFSDGNSKVIVTVNGPIEPKIKQELPNMASLEIVVRPSVGVANTRENLLVDKLRSILANLIIRYKYPRQLIQIVVQVLKKDTDEVIINNHNDTIDDLNVFNSEFNNIVNCCYFGLLDANIGLYESFVSVYQAIINEQVVINPSLEQLISCKSTHLVVLSIKENKPHKIAYVDSNGDFTQLQLFKVIDQGFEQGKATFEVFRNIVEKKVDDDFVWKKN